MKIGVISDTHGLLRPEVLPALAGVDRILHLGDVGRIAILRELKSVAPVIAIRGNIDREPPCNELPAAEVTAVGSHHIYLLHDLKTLDLDPSAGQFSAVLFGHTHAPTVYRKREVLYFNPGSCGPRRFNLPITIGMLVLNDNNQLEATIIPLSPGS